MLSSPRERGSSEQLEELRAGHAVVPARAGVIRTGTTGRPRKPGRPRASGGHPREDATIVCLEWSSPRERGSSAAPGDPRRRAGVVPARAGVIRRDRTGRGRHDRRPRASGGHPSVRAYPRRVVPSSPRERGSSAFDRGRGQRAGVVPARAGVIRTRHGGWATPTSRPRASGGHPRSTSRSGAASMSSPRERGSSVIVSLRDAIVEVVPARAGVIRAYGHTHGALCRRPRASGGHPHLIAGGASVPESSPRERGSSGLGMETGRHRRFVPARAGVIRALHRDLARRRCRPRASGGHPRTCVASITEAVSSPRERGSSGLARRRRPGPRVVPARAGVIRDHGGLGEESGCRPRASGGHPTRRSHRERLEESSPRERGSSVVRRLPAMMRLVVPARAGVIRRR